MYLDERGIEIVPRKSLLLLQFDWFGHIFDFLFMLHILTAKRLPDV